MLDDSAGTINRNILCRHEENDNEKEHSKDVDIVAMMDGVRLHVTLDPIVHQISTWC
jgi:hypothetical protein